jgi:hypothetical protein
MQIAIKTKNPAIPAGVLLQYANLSKKQKLPESEIPAISL